MRTDRKWLRDRWAFLPLVVGLCCAFASVSSAHELQPGYLELRLVDTGLYAAQWKIPVTGGRPMAIKAVLPENCVQRSSEDLRWDGAAYVARWSASCAGGLEGGLITIEGLEKTSTDVLVRFDFADGVNEARRLTPGEPSFKVPVQPNSFEVARAYMLLGIEHILLGIDHLLFVLALLILVKGTRRMVITITAFTVAHSLTLSAATLGFVHVPGPPVEAVIALSIVFIALEIVRSRQGQVGLTERFPWIVAFTFGLLHGFGFAGALAELGLPQQSIRIALLFFNVGVEAGQLLFIGVVFLLTVILRLVTGRVSLTGPGWSWAIPPYVIGSVAAFWVLQRIAVFV